MDSSDVTLSDSTVVAQEVVTPPTPAPAAPTLIGYKALLVEGWNLVSNNLRLVGGSILALMLGIGIVIIGVTALSFLAGAVTMSPVALIPIIIFGLAGILGGYYYASVVMIALMRGLLFSEEQKSIWVRISESWNVGWAFMLVSFYTGVFTNAGLYAFIIPGFVAMGYFGLSTFALIAENRRGTQALVRNVHLVRGYWWGTFGRMLLPGLIIYAAFLVIIMLPLGPLSAILTIPVGLFGVFWVFACLSILFRSLQTINTPAAFEAENHATLTMALRVLLVVICLLVLSIVAFFAHFFGALFYSL